MKKILTILTIIMLILLTGCTSPQESELVSSDAAYEITVYVTKTGECYHTADCDCLSKSKIEKTLSVAAERYRPCQLCFPPIISEE